MLPPLASWEHTLLAPLRSAGLVELPAHLHTVLLAAAGYHVLFLLSPPVSAWAVPRAYAALKPRTRLNWDIHVVSTVQSVVVLARLLPLLLHSPLGDSPAQRILGYAPALGELHALAVGYFVWDAVVSVKYVALFGPGFAVHGLASLLQFVLSFRPFLMGYGPAVLLFEASTPLLNIHWFLDKTGRTGSRAQILNGVLLVLVFFAARIAWGWLVAFRIARDCAALPALPAWLVGYTAAQIAVLWALNLFWFSKMVAALSRRFRGQRGSNSPAAAASQPQHSHSL